MSKFREGDVICKDPRIIVVEKTGQFVTIGSPRVTATIHEVMWHKGYSFVGPSTGFSDEIYHTTFQKTH